MVEGVQQGPVLVGTFSSRRGIRRRQGRRYVCVSVTALTALFICLFQVKIFDVVF